MQVLQTPFVMIDLETLDTKESSVILAIGAVRFTASEVLDEMYTEVNIDDQLKLGRTISGKTLQWWMEQNQEARTVFEQIDSAPRLSSALAKLAGFVGRETTVWGNGATFDISILRNAYQSLGIDTPWPWYNERCYRTLKSLYPDLVKPTVDGRVEHHALSDARVQAIHMQKLLQCVAIPS